MTVFLTGQADSYAQLLTVLLIFVVVLAATAFTTKWIAGYQKQQGISGNIELLDAVRLNNNKYIQIVRLGETYVAVAVCKDTVTLLGEIPQEQLKLQDGSVQNLSFADVLGRFKQGSKQDINPVSAAEESHMEEGNTLHISGGRELSKDK